MKCRKCGSESIKKNGLRGEAGQRYQRYRCRDCNCGTPCDEKDGGQKAETAEFLEEGNNAIATLPAAGKPPTLESLFLKFEIDPDEWNVVSFKINEWQQNNKIDGRVSLYQGKATLVRKRPAHYEWPALRPQSHKPIPMNLDSRPTKAVETTVIVTDGQVGFWRAMDGYKVHGLHDRRAFACATKVIQEIRPSHLILGGDMLDLPDWSDHFVQSPEFVASSQMSINWLASWIASVRPYCGRMTFIDGNHEFRLARNILNNAAASYKLKPANMPEAPPLMSIASMLGLEALGVDHKGPYPRGHVWVNKSLKVIHGEKVGAKSGQTVMKMLDSANCSLVQGHVHRSEDAHATVYHERGVEVHGAHSLGALCRNDGAVCGSKGRDNWQQSVAVVQHDDVDYQLDQIKIVDGRMIFNGNSFQVPDDLQNEYTDNEAAEIWNGKFNGSLPAVERRSGNECR
jgi:hypothetical protein